MEIGTIQQLIKNLMKGYFKRVKTIRKAELYYQNQNDIERQSNPLEDKIRDKKGLNPLRNADHRISHAWHWLLVDQKAAFMMTEPPTFDVGDKSLNDEIVKLLGDSYPKVAKDLCVNASNAGVAWLHVWRDETYHNFFRYAVVDTKQIIPIYSKRLSNQLEGLLRIYEDYDESGESLIVYEYWNESECAVYSKKKKEKFTDIRAQDVFNDLDISTNEVVGKTNIFKHDWGAVPFIPFRNNPMELSDLKKYKKLIDVYDKVYSGYVNDLDDIQEVIFVLTNYGGEDKQEFLNDLKRYKMVKLESDGNEDREGLETLSIEIPIEARNSLLEVTHNAIFLQGQGVDPQKEIGQNNSGAALEYMYTLLELKSSMMETEFRQGFGELVRFILLYSNFNGDVRIEQKWKRTSIKDMSSMAEAIAKLAPVTSQEAIARNNPLVEDAEKELKALKTEQAHDFRGEEDFKQPKGVSEDGED